MYKHAVFMKVREVKNFYKWWQVVLKKSVFLGQYFLQLYVMKVHLPSVINNFILAALIPFGL